MIDIDVKRSGQGWVLRQQQLQLVEMRFSHRLSSHLTPEWRKHYVQYDKLKKMIYEMTGQPLNTSDDDAGKECTVMRCCYTGGVCGSLSLTHTCTYTKENKHLHQRNSVFLEHVT